jgi:thiol-disulfide isomerase/thioredoxin
MRAGLRRGTHLFAVVLLCTACANNKSEAKPATPPPPPPKADPPSSAPKKDGGGAARAADTGSLPGIDLTGLDPSQIEALNRLLDEKPSACGKGHSLRTSLKTDPGCKRSAFAGRYLVRLLKAGLLGSEAEEIYDKRFTAPEMGSCDARDAQVRGNPNAALILCEFSDFQCPHCKMMEPVLSRVLDEYSGQVKLIYKNYPISKLHPEARDAAAAAVAAGDQGKFWPMHDKLFANQDHLTPADLEKYAREIKLDVKKWKVDLAGAMVRVEKEHTEGEKLEITGTPTLYINGRKYAGPLRFEEVRDWIDEELAK